MSSATTTTTTTVASLIVADNKAAVSTALTSAIASIAATALAERGAFVIALSGGSLPSFLWPALNDAFAAHNGLDPMYDCWHVLLADERCVPHNHEDNNLKSIRENFLNHCPSIPSSQIHGINEELLQVSTDAVAKDYDATVKEVLNKPGVGGQLDLAVLGFGPDGHTCSLFPGHALLTTTNNNDYVLPIEDSPKPPPKRITLTLHVLNKRTRHVIVCGAGDSKSPILQAIFEKVVQVDDATTTTTSNSSSSKHYQATLKNPAPYPCAMVRPDTEGVENTLTWVVDAEAMEGVVTPTTMSTS